MKKTYQLKQVLRLGGERFEVRDEEGNLAFQATGSFLKAPKLLTVRDADGLVISQIKKEWRTLLPKFSVRLADGLTFFLQKKLRFTTDTYQLKEAILVVQGQLTDSNFTLTNEQGEPVAEVTKQVHRLTSSYQIEVIDDRLTPQLISLLLVIAYLETRDNHS